MNRNLVLIFVFSTLLLVFIFIFSKTQIGSFFYEQIPVTEQSYQPTEVYFCPADNCGLRLESLLKTSNTSIHCAFYDISLSNIIEALNLKNSDVKLIIDKQNTEKIGTSNFKLKTNTGKGQLMHNKFCVIDGKIVFTGSFNPTESQDKYDDNNILIIYSYYLSQNYESEFQELWDGDFGSGKKTRYSHIRLNDGRVENYFCPEDDCADQIIEELDKSSFSVYFMTFAFTHEKIADEIIKKHLSGVEVAGVIDKFQSSRWSQFENLKNAGIDVRWDKNPHLMHNKVFIIDNKTVITGSFNPTKSADEKNDENILIIEDSEIAKKYLEEFDRIF